MFYGRHFDREIIVLCVRWYLRYQLSLLDLVEMTATTISGIELMHRIRKGQFDLCAPGIKGTSTPSVLNTILFNQ